MFDDDDDDFSRMSSLDEAPAADAAKGLLPVLVDFPRQGRPFQFERLILLPAVWLQLEADWKYDEKKTGRKKRSLRGGCCS
jgi:hypothetical protein